MSTTHCVNLLPLLGETLLPKTNDQSTSVAQKSKLKNFLSDKENFNSNLGKPFSGSSLGNIIDQDSHYFHILDIPSDKMINHDEELKQYLTSKKPIKRKTFKVLDSNKTQINPSTVLSYKPLKHQRTKSKSHLITHEHSCSNSLQISNRISSHDHRQLHIPLIKKSIKQNTNLQERLSEFRRKTEKSRKSIKFWEVNQENFKQLEFKSLEMQLVVRKANEKRQSIIKEIIKKLHLPQLTPHLSNSLRMLVDSYPQKQEIQSEHRLIKLHKCQKSKLFIGKVEALSNLKIHNEKGKDLRRVEKEVYLNRIKFNQMKDEGMTWRSKHLGRQAETLQKFRLFGR